MVPGLPVQWCPAVAETISLKVADRVEPLTGATLPSVLLNVISLELKISQVVLG